MKTLLKIHRFENELWGRCHLPFFKDFDKYLSNYFDIESINYNKDGQTFSGTINLLSDISNFGNTPPISDVECVIENTKTKEIKLLSFTEYFNSYAVHIAKSIQCTKTLLSHFNSTNLYYWLRRENSISAISKIKPWIFLPFQQFNVDLYREKRKTIKELNNQMFWLGSGVDAYRKMIRIIEEKGFLQKIVPVSHDDYLNRMINSKIGISYYLDLNKYTTPFDHPGEFCYRDIEYMLLGIPFIRIEFKDTIHNPLLPNIHYISIPREQAYVEYEKNKDLGVANLYINKYNEIHNDQLFLDYITNNQLHWADTNLLNYNAEKLTFELLELNRWL